MERDIIPATPETLPPPGWILATLENDGKSYWVNPKLIADHGNWQGAQGQVEAKLDRILNNTEVLVSQPLPYDASRSPCAEPALTKKEVARLFQVSTRTLDRWRSMGVDLGELTIEGTIRFDPAKIADIIATQKVRRRRRS
jgi:hypothetical protein